MASRATDVALKCNELTACNFTSEKNAMGETSPERSNT
jgi:hypothetical protein